MLKKHDFL